jgi:regulator of RNase E activity RraB
MLAIKMTSMGLFNFFKPNVGNRFLPEKHFSKIMRNQSLMTPEALAQLKKRGVSSSDNRKLEYFFYTNTIKKANSLANELRELKYEVTSRKVKNGKQYVITGWTGEICLDEKTTLSWVREMCALGYKHDCEFDGWGTFV